MREELFVNRKKSVFERGNPPKNYQKYNQEYIDPASDKNYRVMESCNSYSICEKICPVGNIEMNSGKPFWKNNCQQCMACIQYCPQEAIQYGDKTDNKKHYHNPYIRAVDLFGQKAGAFKA